MRKKMEIVLTAAHLAGELSSVSKAVVTTKDGVEVDLTPYAHGAGVALGLMVTYAFGESEPTVEEIVGVAMDWTDKVAKEAAEHPERVRKMTFDPHEGVADHE